MKGKFARVKISELKKRPVRSSLGSNEELMALARSWLANPIHDIVVRQDMTIADGHRRVAGLELLGETEVTVCIRDEDWSDGDLTKIGLVTAIHCADLSVYDKWKGCEKWLELHPGGDQKTLAEDLNISASYVPRLLSPGKLSREWQEALKAGKVGISDCYAASQVDESEQAKMLADKLAGASRDALARAGRRKRLAATPAVRTKKIKCPLPSGHVITVTGDELSLDQAIDSLKEAIKAMTKARDTGLNASTAQKVWADMAKAG